MKMKVMKEILGLRGYTVHKEEENILPFTKPDGKKGQVVFIQRDKANVDDLAEIFRAVVKDPIHVIVVYKVMTNPAINSFKNEISKYFKDSELIPISKLARNPMEHHKTPTSYTKLSNEEKDIVLKQYKSSSEKFPAMSPTDIIAVLFGFREGDMMEIVSHYNYTTKQKDMDMPPQVTYRVVRHES